MKLRGGIGFKNLEFPGLGCSARFTFVFYAGIFLLEKPEAVTIFQLPCLMREDFILSSSLGHTYHSVQCSREWPDPEA